MSVHYPGDAAKATVEEFLPLGVERSAPHVFGAHYLVPKCRERGSNRAGIINGPLKLLLWTQLIVLSIPTTNAILRSQRPNLPRSRKAKIAARSLTITRTTHSPFGAPKIPRRRRPAIPLWLRSWPSVGSHGTGNTFFVGR